MYYKKYPRYGANILFGNRTMTSQYQQLAKLRMQGRMRQDMPVYKENSKKTMKRRM
jgi:hypothetical protein